MNDKIKPIKLKILLIVVFVLISSCIKAQDVLTQSINKDYSTYLLSDAFEELEHDFNLIFFYKENWIDSLSVSAHPTNISIRQFLTHILDHNKLDHIQIQGRKVVLIPIGYNLVFNDELPSFIKQIGNPLEKGKYPINNIRGKVYYGKTGDPIVGAIIYNKQYGKQTVTDYNGFYSLNLPCGLTEIEYSFIGLETNKVEVEVFSPGNLNCELYEAAIQIKAVNISAYGGRNNIAHTQMGVVHIEMKNLKKLPVLMGEADIIKAMTLLPGVNTTGEISSGFNVRGGNVDQNQVLISGIPIYNTAHLFGLFSTIIPSSVSDVDFHKGTQTANYGGRVSSVMDIKIKDPANNKIQGKAGIGLLNSSLFIEGPIKKDCCTFSLGGRTTYSNWLLKTIPDIDIRQSEAGFYDLVGNVNFKLNKKNKIKLFSYYSSDLFKYSNKNIYSYASFLSGLNYRLIISDFISMDLNLSYTNYTNDLSSIEDPILASTVNTGISQLLGKAQFAMQIAEHNILFGAEATDYKINPGIKEKYGSESTIIAETIAQEKAIEIAGFLQDNYTITEKLSLIAGLRYSWYSKYGPAQSFVYDANKPISDNSVTDTIMHASGEMVKPYFGFEPRIGIKYGINDVSSVKGGYHISKQYQHLISNSSSPTPSDYWKSADLNIKPMTGQQFSLGYFRNFFNNSIETSAEVYYKTVNNPIEYRNGAVLTMNPNIERDVIAGESKAYGLELMIKKTSGKLNGWVSYTLSKSLIRVNGEFDEDKINNGNYFPTYNDRLNDFSISANYQITRRWNFAGNFVYSSGRPATFPEEKYVYRLTDVVYFSERNKYRLPAYHRMDVSITYEGILKKSKRVHPSFTFSIYNLYGRNNVYSVYYKNAPPSELNDYNSYGLYQLSIIGVPVPSITVNLKF